MKSATSIIALLCVLACVQSRHILPDHRIVNGDDVRPGQFPYMISLRDTATSMHECGGSFITVQHVLTAAHCVYEKSGPKDVFVVSGTNMLSKGGEVHEVVEFRIHEAYIGRPNTWKDDIAILKLSKPVELNAFRQLIPLSTQNATDGEDCIISGWGRTAVDDLSLPDNMQTLHQFIMNRDECLKIAFDVQETHLCAYLRPGQGSCQGDSGGPLVCGGEARGICSWNFPCALGKPDMYTSVSYFLDWIHERIQDVDTI